MIQSAGDQYAEWLHNFGIIDAEMATGRVEDAVRHAAQLLEH